MVQPNWGLLQGGMGLNYINYGMQLGRDARERQDTRELNNALAAYVTNPQDTKALDTITQRNPQMGMQFRQQQQAAADKARTQGLIERAAQGDEAALISLWGIDYNVASKLDDASKKKTLGAINYIADAAFQIVQLPEEQRGAAWDAYIDQGMQAYPGLAQYKGKYSPEALNSIVAQAGKNKEFQQFQQPRYIPVGEQGLQGLQYGRPMEGGRMLAPQAPAQQGNLPRPASKADYDKLKPGTQYVDPEGVLRTKPGGAGGNASSSFRPVSNGVSVIQQVFPNARVTSGYRGPDHPLSKKNPNSFHTRTRAAADIAPIPGMTFEQAKAQLEAAGYYVHPDSRDEVNNPSGHATGPHWHFVIGAR